MSSTVSWKKAVNSHAEVLYVSGMDELPRINSEKAILAQFSQEFTSESTRLDVEENGDPIRALGEDEDKVFAKFTWNNDDLVRKYKS